MKKLIKMLSAMLLVLNGFAQETISTDRKLAIGIHAGPAAATLVGNQEYSSNLTVKPRLGFIGGLFFEYQMIPRLALCFEANYESRGWREVGNFFWVNATPNSYYYLGNEIEIIHEYITIPSLVKFKLNKKKTALYVKVGLNTEYLLRSGMRIYPGGETHYTQNARYFNFSAVTGFGVTIPIKERGMFSIEARNNFGFIDILKYPSPTVFSLLFGFGYKI